MRYAVGTGMSRPNPIVLMNKRLLLRKIHRYLALAVGIQLLFWSAGGLFFSLVPIEQIHGDHLVDRKHLSISTENGVTGCLTPGEALDRVLQSVEGENVQGIRVARSSLMPYIQVETAGERLGFDYCTGEPLGLLSEAAVTQAAARVTQNAGAIVSVQRIDAVGDGHEYRGGPLPAYRVLYEGNDSLHLYLDARTGDVTSVRTARWRIFDFLWMLHIMDYDEREDFNHWLLQVFALMALVTSLSGLVLWWASRRKRRRPCRVDSQES